MFNVNLEESGILKKLEKLQFSRISACLFFQLLCHLSNTTFELLSGYPRNIYMCVCKYVCFYVIAIKICIKWSRVEV